MTGSRARSAWAPDRRRLSGLALSLAMGRGGTAGPLPAAAPAAAPPPRREISEPRAKRSGRNLLVEVNVEYLELKEAASFVVGDGEQANHVVGGDKHFARGGDKGQGVEFKKWGFIVNVLPATNPANENEVSVQLQIELSGPLKASEGLDIVSWQYQTQAHLVKGQKAALVQSPARLQITVHDVKSPRSASE